MRELSVVAYYGMKPRQLAWLIQSVQAAISKELGCAFVPRDLDQIHATLIGVGRIDDSTEDRSVLPMDTRKPQYPVDVSGLTGYLCSVFKSHDLTVQFGGFEDRDYQLSSRGRRLYERSFVRNDRNLVLIGWPVRDVEGQREPSTIVASIRRDCSRFGAVHKYDDGPTATDPDLYLVVGRWTSSESIQTSPARVRLERVIRQLLLGSRTTVRMTSSDLVAIAYSDRALPRASSQTAPLCGLMNSHELQRFLQSDKH